MSTGRLKELGIWLHAVPAKLRKMAGSSDVFFLHTINILVKLHNTKADLPTPVGRTAGLLTDTTSWPQESSWFLHHHQFGWKYPKFQGNRQKYHEGKSKSATAMEIKIWIHASFPFKLPDLSFPSSRLPPTHHGTTPPIPLYTALG